MNLLHRLFGEARADIWKRLSEQVHGEFTSGGLLASDRVTATVGIWTVTLDTYAEPVGRASVLYTRLRAPYVNHDNFRFVAYDRGLLDDVGKRLGLQDVEIGHPEFDARFILQGNDQDKVRAFFSDASLRDLMLRRASLRFEVKDDEGWFGGAFPQGVDELCYQTAGVIRDLEHLSEVYALFSEALHQLCRIGSAYENEPVPPIQALQTQH